MGWGEGRTPALPRSVSPSTDHCAGGQKKEPYEVENGPACNRENSQYSDQGIQRFSPLSQSSGAPHPRSLCSVTPASGPEGAIHEPACSPRSSPPPRSLGPSFSPAR